MFQNIDFHFFLWLSHFLSLSWGCQKTNNQGIYQSMYNIYQMHTLVTSLPTLHWKMNGLLLSWKYVLAITLKIIVFLNYQLKNCTEIFFFILNLFLSYETFLQNIKTTPPTWRILFQQSFKYLPYLGIDFTTEKVISQEKVRWVCMFQIMEIGFQLCYRRKG